MSNFVSIIFCGRCHSRYVEISEFSREGNAVVHCRTCDYREEVRGFTLGRGQISNSELQNARQTTAKKGVIREDKYEK